MLSTSSLLAFDLASLVLVLVPGPSVLFVVGRSLALGRRGGLLSVLGNALGMLPQVAAVALGVGALVTRSLLVLTVVKLAGAAYLIWLGVQAIRHRHARTDIGPVVGGSTRRLVLQGALVGVTNPKSIVFFVAVLPQFLDTPAPGAGPVGVQMAVLGCVFVAVALVCDSLWALAAGSARHLLTGRPERTARLGAAGGVMMIGLGGTLAVTGTRT